MQTHSQVLMIHRSNLICEVLRESLEQRNFAVVSYATSGEEGLNKVLSYHPDVVIISNSLPEISGVEIVERLKGSPFKGKFIFLSQNAKDACLVTRRLNVEGHIHTFDGMSELFFALQEIKAGRKYVSSSVEKEVSKITKEELAISHLDTSVLQNLTKREIQIMQFLAQSYTTPQIAKQFLISPSTVNNHRANIIQKLNLKGRNQLIGVAISLKPFYKISSI